jgi:hypothetical protein
MRKQQLRSRRKEEEVTPAERRSEVERHLKEMVEEGVELTGRAVMRRMGLGDDRSIRKIWDALAAEGRVPARKTGTGAHDYNEQQVSRWQAKPYSPSGPAGKILVEIEQRYRAFTEQLRLTDEQRRTPDAVHWWGEYLTRLSQLHEVAVREVYGTGVDHLIEEFRTMMDQNEGTGT